MKGFTPIEEALMPSQLKAACSRLLVDAIGAPENFENLASELPILLVRSAHRGLFESFLKALSEQCPDQRLIVLSHARDEAYVNEVVTNEFDFLPYPVEGRYCKEDLEKCFPSLHSMELGAKVLLDGSGFMADLDHVVEMLEWVGGEYLCAWCDLGPSLIRLGPKEKRLAAMSALEALAEWNALNLS